MRTTNLVLTVYASIALAVILMPPPSIAAMTNLVVNGEFETPVIDPASNNGRREQIQTVPDGPGIGSQWSTEASNDFELHEQGHRANATGTDGNSTGQYLEVRGNDANGIITLTIDVPGNIVAGSNATFRFDGASRVGNSQASLTSGVYRVQVSGINAFDSSTTNVDNLANGAWRNYSESFLLSPGDTVTVTWQETGGNGNSNTGRSRGLRIDQVELLAQVIPEPATFGVVSLSFFILLCQRRKVT